MGRVSVQYRANINTVGTYAVPRRFGFFYDIRLFALKHMQWKLNMFAKEAVRTDLRINEHKTHEQIQNFCNNKRGFRWCRWERDIQGLS